MKCKCFKKIPKYKYHKLIWHLITKKCTVADIKFAVRVADTVDKLFKFKNITSEDKPYLTREAVEKAVKFHNTYTSGKKIYLFKYLAILEAGKSWIDILMKPSSPLTSIVSSIMKHAKKK